VLRAWQKAVGHLNWRKWKRVPSATLYEAVALSLNIDPEQIRRNPRAWMGGKRFAEDQEFLDRLFVANRNIDNLGPRNYMGVRYYEEDPVVNLQAFAAWAASIGWHLPAELVGPATAPQSAVPVAALGVPAQVAGAQGPKVDLEDDLGPIPNRPGSPGVKMTKAITAMVDAVKKGDILLSTLRRMKQKELNTFNKNARRTTLAAARVEALKQLSQLGWFDKDPT
jgi:hypothetical protein